MYSGTLLGMLWTAMYASCILGFTSLVFTLLFLLLNISSPFYAGYLAVQYRKRECGNRMGFIQAWTFVLVMYLCASMLAAVVQFVYFRFMDNGYFTLVMSEIAAIIKENPAIAGDMAAQIEQAMSTLTSMTPKDLVTDMFSSNIMNATILAPIIALFVKKSNNENR